MDIGGYGCGGGGGRFFLGKGGLGGEDHFTRATPVLSPLMTALCVRLHTLTVTVHIAVRLSASLISASDRLPDRRIFQSFVWPLRAQK